MVFSKNSRKADFPYYAIPFGVMFLCISVAILLSDTRWAAIFAYAGMFFSIFALLAILFNPTFLKPAWLKWLEREHGEHWPIIKQEAQEIGLDVWQEKIKTDWELQLWVEYVLYKHGLPNKNPLFDKEVPVDPFAFS